MLSMPLLTHRLRLRRPTMDDAQRIFDGYAQDEIVTRFLTWRPHACLGETVQFLESMSHAIEAGQVVAFVLTDLASSDDPIGMLEVRIDRHKRTLGFVLSREYHRRGLMTEATRAVLSRIMQKTESIRVQAYCDVDNHASVGVLRNIGMSCEGVIRGWETHPNVSARPRDCLLFSITTWHG